MINDDTLQKVIEWGTSDDGDGVRVDSKAPRWITTGHWAARSLGPSEVYQGARDLDGQLAGVINDAMRRPLVELEENKDLRIERVEETVVNGCDGCACGKCDGSSTWTHIETKEAGQAVFQNDAGDVVVLNPVYAPLLEGLLVRACAAELPKTPLLGFDDKGELVAIVMPMNIAPRDPAAVKELDSKTADM